MRPDQYGAVEPGRLTVRGLGLRLPGGRSPADLVRQLTGHAPAPRTTRRLVAAQTDLAPVEQPVYGPVDVLMPARVPTRGLRNLPEESLLALAAAAEAETAAETPVGAATGPTAVVWASSTAGLAEYATLCVEAAVLEPGLTSPIIGPASAFNGPAATISIRLGLPGPNETLTGGTTAGMSSLAEAYRLLVAGEAGRVLVGASATVSRWSLAGSDGAFIPGEGAACLALEPAQAGDHGIRLGRCRRIGLDRSRWLTQVRELAAGAGGRTPIIVSAPDEAVVKDLATYLPGPVRHVEHALGDFGAAGGLIAVAAAVAYCTTEAPTARTVLALAVEPSGNAAIMEVSSC